MTTEEEKIVMKHNQENVDRWAMIMDNERLVEALVSYSRLSQVAMSRDDDSWFGHIDMVNRLKAKVIERMN